jgi:hypothetical protein
MVNMVDVSVREHLGVSWVVFRDYNCGTTMLPVAKVVQACDAKVVPQLLGDTGRRMNKAANY